MAHKENLFPLKMLVISLGALLIGGLIFLATLVIERQKPCAPEAVNVAEYGQIISLTPERGGLSVVAKKGAEYTYLNIDRCSGEVRERMRVTGQ